MTPGRFATDESPIDRKLTVTAQQAAVNLLRSSKLCKDKATYMVIDIL